MAQLIAQGIRSVKNNLRKALSLRFCALQIVCSIVAVGGPATAFAAILGVLPIAIGFGAGADSRVPLGVAVVGGLIFSQFLTLYITPAFYLWFDRWGTSRARQMLAE